MIINILKYWHPKIALRYLPMAEEIKKELTNSRINEFTNKVLEIGSGSIGIAPYLGLPVVGVDKEFKGKSCPLLKQVVADGLQLPFADKSFDYVVSSDVLEHIDPANRKQAIAEWLRVAKKELILGFPEGEISEKHDQIIYEMFKKKHLDDVAQVFFREHLKNGLPKIEDVKKNIEESMGEWNREADITIQDNLNISLREFLMKGWMTKNLFVDFFFRKIMLLLIPILRLFNQKPVYRKIIFVKFL